MILFLKNTPKKISLYFFLFLPSLGIGQITLERSFSFPTTLVSKVSSDPYGNFYIADEKGNVVKYDSLGRQLLIYSPQKNSPVTLIDAWRNVNIFIFYENFQEFKILNRFLTETTRHRFKNDRIGFIRVANVSSDNNLWLIDNDDFSLKKLNLTFNKVELENSLQLVLPRAEYDFKYLREYNGNIYLADINSGILVFDNLANFRTRITGKNIEYFSFKGNYIYYLEEGELILANILTNKFQRISLPDGENVKFVFLENDKLYLFKKAEAVVYRHSIKL